MQEFIAPYSGWASYKNVISGNYNRRLCWTCSTAKSFPQAAGVYPLNVTTNVTTNEPQSNNQLNNEYLLYQEARMSNNPGTVASGYYNYHNKERYNLYPRQYVKGYWPDESKGSVTMTPR
jgi:hypothetical protein